MPATSVNGQVATRLDVFPRVDHVNVRSFIVTRHCVLESNTNYSDFISFLQNISNRLG